MVAWRITITMILISICDDHACGAVNKTIVGGRLATINEFGYHAVLQQYHPQSEWPRQMNPICGATIIDEKWLLTASHCILDLNQYAYSFNPKTFYVSINLDRISGYSKAIRVAVKQSHVHPQLSPHHRYPFHPDIALIELKEKIKLKRPIRKVDLPSSSDTYVRLEVAGFGMPNRYNPINQVSFARFMSNHMKATNVTLTDPNICLRVHGWKFVTEQMLCVGPYGEPNACVGDSGGGLIGITTTNRSVIVGIVSFGTMICNREINPVVFSDVLFHKEWIETVVRAYQGPKYPRS